MATPKKVRFKDLPDHACFRPRVKSNPGKKLGWDLMIWHGNSSAERVFGGKPRKGMITTKTMVIPVPCPGERLIQPAKTKLKCSRLRSAYRGVMRDIDEEMKLPRDERDLQWLQDRADKILFDAMDLDCGWVDTE